MNMPIVYEDKYLIVVNKPQGIAVEDDRYGNASITAMLHKKYDDSLPSNGIIQNVHRLDKQVSGTLLYALKPSVLKQLNEQFAAKEVHKTYLCIVTTKPPQQEEMLSHWIYKDNKNYRAKIKSGPADGVVLAELNYRLLATQGDRYLLEIDLISGKYHQIRAQLSHIGCPILGDDKYGSKAVYKENAIALHARRLRFTHPIETMMVDAVAPVPDDAAWATFLPNI